MQCSSSAGSRWVTQIGMSIIVECAFHMKHIEILLHLARLWIYDITIHMKLNVLCLITKLNIIAHCGH